MVVGAMMILVTGLQPCQYLDTRNSYPCCHPSITGGDPTTPAVAGQDGDEGDEVEEGGDQREDDLHHQELEGKFHLRR